MATAATLCCAQVPNMAICDANLVDNMPKSLTAFGGLDALVHALESYVSVCATDYTKGEWRGCCTAACSQRVAGSLTCGWVCLVCGGGSWEFCWSREGGRTSCRRLVGSLGLGP
jgi:hypothetical protein